VIRRYLHFLPVILTCNNGMTRVESTLLYLAVDPFWYGVGSDPRYADMLRRIGLPQ
jgi:hypothetical protein